MADETGIRWTDSTMNFWHGCMKIAAGCDNCYAEAFDQRFGPSHWGPHAVYKRMSEATLVKPLKWNKEASKNGVRHRVFCGSMMDWADNRAEESLRVRMWQTIRSTPMLDWQLLTKRAVNIQRFLPSDWSEGYSNVILGVTVENKAEGLPRLERLKTIPAKRRFLSIEPLLEDLGPVDFTGIDWVIVGGESGREARPMDPQWARNIQKQCEKQGVAFFFKQMGARSNNGLDKGAHDLDGIEYVEWPKDLPGQPYRRTIPIFSSNHLIRACGQGTR